MLRYTRSADWFKMTDMIIDEQYKRYAKRLGKQMAIIAGAWAILYFPSQSFNEGLFWPLFSLLVGGLVGLVAGWWVAENAVEEAGFSGLSLWIILVAACVGAFWGTEIILGTVVPWVSSWFGHPGPWPIGFGRWMMLSSATILAMVSAVWRASADD